MMVVVRWDIEFIYVHISFEGASQADETYPAAEAPGVDLFWKRVVVD